MAAIDTRYVWHPSDAARALVVSAVRVRQMDAELKPVRVLVGAGKRSERRYDPRIVMRVARRRATVRDTR